MIVAVKGARFLGGSRGGVGSQVRARRIGAHRVVYRAAAIDQRLDLIDQPFRVLGVRELLVVESLEDRREVRDVARERAVENPGAQLVELCR